MSCGLRTPNTLVESTLYNLAETQTVCAMIMFVYVGCLSLIGSGFYFYRDGVVGWFII